MCERETVSTCRVDTKQEKDKTKQKQEERKIRSIHPQGKSRVVQNSKTGNHSRTRREGKTNRILLTRVKCYRLSDPYAAQQGSRLGIVGTRGSMVIRLRPWGGVLVVLQTRRGGGFSKIGNRQSPSDQNHLSFLAARQYN